MCVCVKCRAVFPLNVNPLILTDSLLMCHSIDHERKFSFLSFSTPFLEDGQRSRPAKKQNVAGQDSELS